MNDAIAIKAYVTKWALTKGILQVEGHRLSHGRLQWVEPNKQIHCMTAGEWTEDPVEAITQAETLRTKKLQLLAAQTRRVQSKQFIIADIRRHV